MYVGAHSRPGTYGTSEDMPPSTGETSNLGGCLLYTSDAADERSSVDLGGRRIIKKKTHVHTRGQCMHETTSTRQVYRQTTCEQYSNRRLRAYR